MAMNDGKRPAIPTGADKATVPTDANKATVPTDANKETVPAGAGKVAVRPADVWTVIDFLETGIVWAVFTERGLAALLFHDGDDQNFDAGPVPGAEREPDTEAERLQLRVPHRIDLRGMLAEGKAFQREAQLVREIVRFLDTGRHKMPLDFSRCTPFQQRVYAAVGSIEPGRLCTYKHVAMMIGQPTAARAVGNALAQEPVAFLLPAHRVVPQGGQSLCRSGSARSRLKLLEREGHDVVQLAGGKVCSRERCCLE